VNCRWNEEKVFPSLSAELERGFVEARLHTDGARGEELTAYEQEVARSIATPLYLVLEPGTMRVLAGPIGGLVSVAGLREFLAGAERAARGEERVGRLEAR
jgi:hypothetical protein